MSMMSRTRSSIAMGTPSFLELKKQASFFFKEKLKTARLALTDVTPLQLLVFFIFGFLLLSFFQESWFLTQIYVYVNLVEE
jgi:hypothetical protein